MLAINFSLTGVCTHESGAAYYVAESGTEFSQINDAVAYYTGQDFLTYRLILTATCGDKMQQKEFLKSL